MKKLTFLTVMMVLPFSMAFAQLNNNPDQIETDNGTLVIHPVMHASVVLEWNNQFIYIDPFGSSELYESFGDPDLILISHPHEDHYNPETLGGLNTTNSIFIVPEAVAELMEEVEYNDLIIMANGESIEQNDISILAVPMYNLPQEDAIHAKGWGNGYVLSIGGTQIYISGDTEDIPEMRALSDIDIAFVCMNLPYTMDINQAASAVLDFEPEIVYPYHHRGQDIQKFKELVDVAGKNIEVRLKDWYSGN